MGELAQHLKNVSGKKQYGYLKAPLKAVVDEIVDELAKDSRIASAYDLWYQLREEVLRTYKDDLPERLPLSQQKEFKRIKNLVIQEAVQLGEYTEVFAPEDDQDQAEVDPAPEEGQVGTLNPMYKPQSDLLSEQKRKKVLNAQYRAARRILADPSAKPEQISNAVDWLTQAAESGLHYAQYALGKLYRDGKLVEQNMVKAAIWFSQSAEQGNQYAMYALGKLNQEVKNFPAALRWFKQSAELGNQYAQYTLGKLYLLGKEVPQGRDAAVRWFTLSAEQGNRYAQYFLDHMDDGPSLFTSATRLLRHVGRIFQEQAPPPSGGISFVDSKLRRKLREKKIAMGHKADDHEEQNIQQYR